MGSKRMHSFYRCPEWCIADHNDPDDRPDDLPEGQIRHYGGLGGDHLDNLSNSATDRPLRTSGGGWDGCLTRIDLLTGHHGVAFVNLNFNAPERGHVDLDFTSGEARSLAASLLRGAAIVESLAPPIYTD